jgi:urease accessory protein
MRLGDYRYYATFYACRVGLAPRARQTLEEQMEELTHNLYLPGESVWGVSILAMHGLVVRGAGMTSHQLMQGLVRCWQLAKGKLYQAEAILPRKIY